MPVVTLPDGSQKTVAAGTTLQAIAESIGKRLAQAAIACRLDGTIVDLTTPLAEKTEPHTLQILTDKDQDALEVLRHSCAHVMARAVVRLFPGTQLAFGPPIENGFYYDIDSPTPIREEDFPRIEAEMAKIVAMAEPFERFERTVPQGRELVAGMGQQYKIEHIDEELHRFGSLSFYRQGEFIDLCRGPHIPHAGRIGAFKILSIAGAYWKNDSNRKQLQRLYATAFFTQKDLDEHIKRMEEAKKRDHRLLGKQLALFTISQQVGPGLILWMPRGALVRGILENFIKDELLRLGYLPVYTPNIGKLELYRTSGHFPYYRDSQFPPLYQHPAAQALDLIQHRLVAGELTLEKEQEMEKFLAQASLSIPGYLEAKTQAEKLALVDDFGRDLIAKFQVVVHGYDSAKDRAGRARALLTWLENQEGYLLKPMNCPHHIQIYKAEPRSYRDLPLRLAEFGTVYRYEQTGELSGMTRVRGFTQDDAHLFMTPEQVEDELHKNIELVLFVLKTLGLNDYRVRIGLRAKNSDKYVGSNEDWDTAEASLIKVVKALDMRYTAEEGEAAFYGPKIDFVVRDCIGREWQLGTVQLDYNLPKRFDLEYAGSDNQSHRPVMIHRAPFGSMERFMGILIEHFAGAFPFWLAPEQARILPVSDKFNDYAKSVEARLREHGFRIAGDYSSDKVGAKIRQASLDKIPFMLVVGDKEQQAGGVAVRHRVKGDQGMITVDALIAQMEQNVKTRALD